MRSEILSKLRENRAINFFNTVQIVCFMKHIDVLVKMLQLFRTSRNVARAAKLNEDSPMRTDT